MDSSFRWNDDEAQMSWIPAFAGMTSARRSVMVIPLQYQSTHPSKPKRPCAIP